MKIAIPMAAGRLCLHFGHCEQFIVFDVDAGTKNINGQESITPPPHEPGLLPKWLSEKGVNSVIAGGIGSRAVTLFTERGVSVITGAPAGDPKDILSDYLAGKLVTGANTCDH